MWEIVPLATTLSTNKYSFLKNFIIGRSLKGHNSSKQKCLRKYNTFGKADYFFNLPYGFPQGPVNFATIHPKPTRKSG
jgi:hypothetical protein